MPALDGLRNWCRANGISISISQNSQRSAKDLLDELFLIGNSAPVYSGNLLKVIPYDEVSAAGNGAIYIAPTASGPIADLGDDDLARDENGEAIGPVKIFRKRRADCDNTVAIEHIDRDNDYSHVVTTEADQKAIAMFGPRKGGTLDSTDLGVNQSGGSKMLLSIHSKTVAQLIGSIIVKVNAAGVPEFSFTLKAENFAFEAMDLVTITDVRQGIVKVPIQFISVKENDNHSIACQARLFVYGLHHPDSRFTTAVNGQQSSINQVDPGLVNAPIIFEPKRAMLSNDTAQIWFIVSGLDPNYGGCAAFVSVDGGSSYSFVGNVPPCVTGSLTADYPNAADPDTTDTLSVDITESNGGALSSNTQQIADAFADPCYLYGTTDYDYEMVCPTNVTPTDVGKYNLDTYIRRGVQGSTIGDHPSTKRFGVVSGALKVDLPGSWIGTPLLFKFAAYNKLQAQQNDLADCVAYPYTPLGLSGVGYTVNPATVLSQASSDATHLQSVQFTVTFSDGKITKYMARDGVTQPKYSISDPGVGGAQTYYVTIYDPNRVGEYDSNGTPTTPLTAYVDTDPNTHALLAGYIFVGKIIATHTGGNTGSVAGPNGINQVLVGVV